MRWLCCFWWDPSEISELTQRWGCSRYISWRKVWFCRWLERNIVHHCNGRIFLGESRKCSHGRLWFRQSKKKAFYFHWCLGYSTFILALLSLWCILWDQPNNFLIPLSKDRYSSFSPAVFPFFSSQETSNIGLALTCWYTLGFFFDEWYRWGRIAGLSDRIL